MKMKLTRKTILISGISLLALILVLTIIIAPNFKPTNSQTDETLAISDHGSAMVLIGDSTQQITGKITVDSFGQVTIQDDLTNEVYDILATQIIDSDQLVAFETIGSDGQATEIVGEVVAQSENGTSTILDPSSGTQYIVETTQLKKVSAEKTVSTQTPTETTIAPTTETFAPKTANTEKTSETSQTSTSKKTTSTTSAQTTTSAEPTTQTTTAAPTTQPTNTAPVVADDITHESYTVSTDPTLETAYIGPTETAASEQPVPEATRMDSNYIQDVMSEINRMRQANGTNLLTLDPATSDYSQLAWGYAEELALGIANNAPDFPHVWIVTQASDGADAVQDLVDLSSVVLDPSVRTVAMSAAKNEATGDIYLVIAF